VTDETEKAFGSKASLKKERNRVLHGRPAPRSRPQCWRGRKYAGHYDEAFDAFDAVAPAADRRIVLAGNPAFLRQHDVGKAGNICDSWMNRIANPISILLLAKPKMLVKNTEETVRA